MRQWINNSISDSRWRSPTNKPVWENYLTDQKNDTGHMFNIKLEKKSYKMSFKALPVKIQRSKNKGHNVGGTIPGADRFKIKDLWKILLILPKKLFFFLRCSYFCTSLVPSISLVDHCGIYRKNYVKINPNVYNTIKCLNWNLKTRIV